MSGERAAPRTRHRWWTRIVQGLCVALVLWAPILLAIVLGLRFPAKALEVKTQMGWSVGLTTGLFALPWSLLGEVMAGNLPLALRELQMLLTMALGWWINTWLALGRWTFQSLLTVAAVLAVLQVLFIALVAV